MRDSLQDRLRATADSGLYAEWSVTAKVLREAADRLDELEVKSDTSPVRADGMIECPHCEGSGWDQERDADCKHCGSAGEVPDLRAVAAGNA